MNSDDVISHYRACREIALRFANLYLVFVIYGRILRESPPVDMVMAPFISVRNILQSKLTYLFKTDGCGK